MAQLLQDQVAVVTGASRGMGRAFAKRLASMGAKVTAAARDGERLEALAGEIAADGGEAFPVVCDVTDKAAIDAMGVAVLEKFGKVDVVINAAGRLDFASFLDESDEQWQGMLDVNLNSARWVTKAFLPTMIENGYGKVIFISSNAAKKGFPNDAGYSVAKAGLMALTKVLAVEYGTKGVEVHCVLPGLIADTDMGEEVIQDHIKRPEFGGDRNKFLAWANTLSPLGYHPSVQEIEDLVAFLATSQGTALHGLCVTADHGFTPY